MDLISISNLIPDARIKALVLEETPQESEDPFSDETPTTIPPSDPTILTAGLTEDPTTLTNGRILTPSDPDATAPSASSTGAPSGNAAAESAWDARAPDSLDPLAESYEMVPRDAGETDTPHSAASALAASNAAAASWADDATATAESSWADESQAAAGAPPPQPDGFQAVHHGGRGRAPRGARPEGRGGRGRGDGRGRGFGGRGDGRGRGRARGEFRGPRRGDGAQ